MSSNSFSQLYWQCRRGNQELDLLCQHYLTAYYPSASIQHQQLFQQLLQLSDAELFTLLFTNQSIHAPLFAELLSQIRHYSV
ncbi:MAG: hypothetical protein RL637_299 [Pseudomonadota bacterium]|jgi:succinate dehydrogenase flavin-adding protein (antitoxin of CptAB toxin-antitoxin module)